MSQLLDVKIDDLIFKDLLRQKYSVVEEPVQDYKTSSGKKQVCFLTNNECFFSEMEQIRKRNAALEEELVALKKEN